MASVVALCTSAKKGEPKTPVASARLREGHGLEGDAHAGCGHRQVSLLALADVESVRARGLPDLAFGAFGENLVVEGLDLEALGLGSRLRLGGCAEVAVSQRGKACHQRCAIYDRAGECIMPDRGLFARVTKGGEVKPGDAVEVFDAVPRGAFQAAVLTVSDSRSRGEAEDTAGPAVARLLREALGAHLYAAEVVPDEQALLESRLRFYADEVGLDLVLAVGGTGFAPRDVTPEAVRAVVERLTPGLDETMRAASLRRTPTAALSRAVSGIRDGTLILSLPGAARAAVENLGVLFPALPHGLRKLRGDATPCGEAALPAAGSPRRRGARGGGVRR